MKEWMICQQASQEIVQTGDSSKLLVVAVCLILSVVLVIAMIIIGMSGKMDDKRNEKIHDDKELE